MVDLSGASSRPHRNYTFDEIRRRLDDPALTIGNALPRAAWEQARIPGSISLPLAEIPAHGRELLPDLERETVLYCGGPRACHVHGKECQRGGGNTTKVEPRLNHVGIVAFGDPALSFHLSDLRRGNHRSERARTKHRRHVSNDGRNR